MKNIPISLDEAREIVWALSVSDHESVCQPALVKSIANKIAAAYPEVLDNKEWVISCGWFDATFNSSHASP